MRPYMQYRIGYEHIIITSRVQCQNTLQTQMIDPVDRVLSLSAITSCQYVVHLIEHHGQTFQYFLVLFAFVPVDTLI
jgi:hypothetical protein